MHAGTRHREPTLGRNVIGKVYNCATGLVIANEPVNRYKREFAGVSERKKAKSRRGVGRRKTRGASAEKRFVVATGARVEGRERRSEG